MTDTKRLVSTCALQENKAFNRHWTTALSAIEDKEPTLAASIALPDANSSGVEHTQGGFIVHLFEKAILKIT